MPCEDELVNGFSNKEIIIFLNRKHDVVVSIRT